MATYNNHVIYLRTCRESSSAMSENDAAAPAFVIRELTNNDRNWVAHFLDEHWGSTKIVSRGEAYYGHLLPGFVAERTGVPDDAPPAGLLTYRLSDKACELMTVNSLQPNTGIGTSLVEAAKQAAREAGCKRLWLIITNDNLAALRFFQKRGFRLEAVYSGSLAEARKLKPQIPLVGLNGIPLFDEIELSFDLTS